jgi:hypothetical protein
MGDSAHALSRQLKFVTLSVAGIAFLGAIISAFYTYTSRNRELDIELVKIGISILRADPRETQTHGAIEVIENYSRQTFSPDAKSELLKYKLEYDGGNGGGGNGGGGGWTVIQRTN